VKWQAKAALIFLLIAVTIAGAQPSTEDQRLSRDTQTRGYWADTSGLVWAGKVNNGKDVSWSQATKYCHDLWLPGYSNWRLATIDELQDIYDANRETPGLAGLGEGRAFTWHVLGGLLLSGDEWSSSRNHDERGHPSGTAIQFDFNDGRRSNDDLGYHAGKRALCVRRSDVVMAPQSATEDHGPAQETQARGYWVDPSTGLIRPGRDNGKEVTWRESRKYCSDMRLAGHADWRMATLDELESLVDRSEHAPQRVGNAEFVFFGVGGSGYVRGNLYVTGNSWSSNQPISRFGHPDGDGAFFDFRTSQPSYDLQLFRNTKRVLCVRRSVD
jgi:hypothetical protein